MNLPPADDLKALWLQLSTAIISNLKNQKYTNHYKLKSSINRVVADCIIDKGQCAETAMIALSRRL